MHARPSQPPPADPARRSGRWTAACWPSPLTTRWGRLPCLPATPSACPPACPPACLCSSGERPAACCWRLNSHAHLSTGLLTHPPTPPQAVEQVRAFLAALFSPPQPMPSLQSEIDVFAELLRAQGIDTGARARSLALCSRCCAPGGGGRGGAAKRTPRPGCPRGRGLRCGQMNPFRPTPGVPAVPEWGPEFCSRLVEPAPGGSGGLVRHADGSVFPEVGVGGGCLSWEEWAGVAGRLRCRGAAARPARVERGRAMPRPSQPWLHADAGLVPRKGLHRPAALPAPGPHRPPRARPGLERVAGRRRRARGAAAAPLPPPQAAVLEAARGAGVLETRWRQQPRLTCMASPIHDRPSPPSAGTSWRCSTSCKRAAGGCGWRSWGAPPTGFP